jgi:hypothetical protein
MRGRRWTRCALMACVILWPGVAHASFWGYLQELSGPGPFWGPDVTVRLACVTDSGIVTCLQDDMPERTHHILNMDVALQWSAGDEERFDDVTGDKGRVWVFRLAPTYQYRVHPALDAGAGVGFARFSGVGFDPINRFTITPVSVTFTPGALDGSTGWAARLFRIRFDELYLPKGFTGADFGNSATSFHTDREWLSSVTLIFDLFEAFRR